MIKSFEKIAQTVDQMTEFSFGDNNFFFEDIMLLCLQIEKLEQFNCDGLFDGALINSCYSTLALWDVKKLVVRITIYISFVQNSSGVSS